MAILAGLSEIADRYDGLLCDAWGVIHDGVNLFDGVAEALTEFRRRRGPVVILTNAPRPNGIIPAQLDRLGLPREAYDAVVTSGDATRAEIMQRLPQPAFRLGPEKDDPLFDGAGITFTPLEEASFIICTGLFDEARETPDDYGDLLRAATARRLPMICANPDIVVRWGGRLIYCAGALAEAYERLGGKVVYAGKPHAPIYELALGAVGRLRGAPVDRRRVLAAGDGLLTDILGANRQGLDSLYIFGSGGVHEGTADAASAVGSLARAGVTAVAAMAELRW